MPYYLTLHSLLSVLRAGKRNWRSVQLFRRTNRKMTNVLNNCNNARFHSATFVGLCDDRFHQSFDSHQKITATGHFDLFHLFLS